MYLSSRRKTVKRTSRAGRSKAKPAARRKIWNVASTGENRCETNRRKPDRAQKRHEHQRDSNSKPFHQTAGKEDLDQHRYRVHRDIDVCQERRARGSVLQLMLGKVGLLKIGPRVRERVDYEKPRQTK